MSSPVLKSGGQEVLPIALLSSSPLEEDLGDQSTLAELTSVALDLRRRLASFEQDRYGQEWTVSDLLLGLVGDLGDLAKLVQAREGKRHVEDLDRALVHEMGDCFWALVVIADRLDINLDQALRTTAADVHRWLDGQTH